MPVLSNEVRQMIRDSVDVETLLVFLGFKIFKTTDKDVRAPCLIHGGDNSTAFSMRLDSKTWRCFTRQCEQDQFGQVNNDLIALVMTVNNLSFMEAVRFLAEFSGINLDFETMMVEIDDAYRRRKDINNHVRSVARLSDTVAKLPKISETAVLNYTLDRDDFFLKQGFLPRTLEKFEVGSKHDGFGVLRATIPIRDHFGNLVSISARREDSDKEPRYLLDCEFQKRKVLYNLNDVICLGVDTVIIVEGFKALWATCEAGFNNVVACMGTALSEEQMLLLCSSGFTNCVLMFDGDVPGQQGALKVLKMLEKAFNVSLVSLPDNKSPDDLNRRELKSILDLYMSAF